MEKSLEDWEKEFVKPDDIQGEDLKKLLEKVVQMKEQGMTIVEIAEKVGCSDTTIVNIMKKHRTT